MHYDRNGALIRSDIEGVPEPRRGKVRDIYEIDGDLLLVATDRISAFDCVMPNGIPDKGRILMGLSKFWFEFFDWMPNHVVTTDVHAFPDILSGYENDLKGRSMLVKKTEPLPVECVCRGYLIGSGWKDYQKNGTVCGIELRAGYTLADQLDVPIFTPAYKAEQGEHDENITFAQVINLIGAESAAFLREKSLKLYSDAAEYARKKGIIIADTKFEFGNVNHDIILIDEVFTPDSSRFWPAARYVAGQNPPSLDKQYVRDYLETKNWNKEPPAPELTDEIVAETRNKYIQAYKELTGNQF